MGVTIGSGYRQTTKFCVIDLVVSCYKKRNKNENDEIDNEKFVAGSYIYGNKFVRN